MLTTEKPYYVHTTTASTTLDVLSNFPPATSIAKDSPSHDRMIDENVAEFVARTPCLPFLQPKHVFIQNATINRLGN
jgi:hypothetical protein